MKAIIMSKKHFLHILLFMYFLKREPLDKGFCLIFTARQYRDKKQFDIQQKLLGLGRKGKAAHCLQIKLSMCKPSMGDKEISLYKAQGDHCCPCVIFQERAYLFFFPSHTQIRSVLSRLKLWKVSQKDSCSVEQDRVSGLLLCYLKIVQDIEISNKADYLAIMSVHYQLHAG